MEPLAERTCRPRMIDFRAVINALRYLVRTGCEWRMLSNDFPPYQTVYYWFRRRMRRMLFKTIHDLVLMLDRLCSRREAKQMILRNASKFRMEFHRSGACSLS